MRSLYPSLYSHTLHLKTESYPTLQFGVDGGRCDGVILYIGECKYILKAGFCCNWSVRCVVCVCCSFVLDRVRSGFVEVLRLLWWSV